MGFILILCSSLHWKLRCAQNCFDRPDPFPLPHHHLFCGQAKEFSLNSQSREGVKNFPGWDPTVRSGQRLRLFAISFSQSQNVSAAVPFSSSHFTRALLPNFRQSL
ncbi:hypothetical protein BKA80DRAFT_76335 [Phyllosticta citrichinensis]